MVADMLPEFVKKLVPPAHDRSLVARRKDNIKTAITNDGLRLVSVFESGSFSHGTGIKAHSDVDVMAWLGYEHKSNLPSSILARVKSAIFRHSQVSNATVSSPTIQVSFWEGPSFEVVPAFFRSSNGHTTYHIGGRSDEWVVSSPTVHNRYVNTENDRLNKRVKPLIRLVKAWKYHVEAPVSSFYLEMRTAKYCSTEKSILYELDIRRIFRTIVFAGVADMNDPAGVAGRIPAVASEDKRRKVKRLMESALDNLEEAATHRQNNSAIDYWLCMTRVFGSDFPYPA